MLLRRARSAMTAREIAEPLIAPLITCQRPRSGVEEARRGNGGWGGLPVVFKYLSARN